MISRDLAIMSFFARLITLFPGMQWLSLPEEVEVFGQMMSQQLDLRHEADNLLTFEKNFSHRNVAVTFPRPLRAWSTKELLVEEYEEALPLENFLRNGGGPLDDQVATMGLDAFLVSCTVVLFYPSHIRPSEHVVAGQFRSLRPASWQHHDQIHQTNISRKCPPEPLLPLDGQQPRQDRPCRKKRF